MLELIAYVSDHPRCHQYEISAVLGLSQSQARKVMMRCIDLGLLDRATHSSPQDHVLWATGAGRAVLADDDIIRQASTVPTKANPSPGGPNADKQRAYRERTGRRR